MYQESNAIVNRFNVVGDQLEKIADDYYFAGRLDDGLMLLGSAVQWAVLPEVTAEFQGRLLIQQAKLMTSYNFLGRGDAEETQVVIQQAIALAETHSSKWLMAAGCQMLGWFLYCRTMRQREGEFADGLAPLQQALDLWRELDDDFGQCQTVFYMGLIHERLGELDEARRFYTESKGLAEEKGFQLELSYAVRHLAFVAYRLGETEQVRPLLEQSLQIRQAIGFELFLPFSYTSLADFALMEGDVETAESLLGEAAVVSEKLGFEMSEMFVKLSQARVFQAQEQMALAREAFAAVMALAERVDHPAVYQQAEAGLQAIAEE